MIKKHKTKQGLGPSFFKKQSGFTIIEVLIVLAIAGLIILIVFLAVPALQRNSRNTQRSEDIGRIVPAMQECLTNNRNSTLYCIDYGGVITDNYIDFSKNLQLTGYGFVVPTDTSPTVDLGYYDSNQMIGFSKILSIPRRKCDDDGKNAHIGTSKNLAIMWKVETSNSNGDWRCQDVN